MALVKRYVRAFFSSSSTGFTLKKDTMMAMSTRDMTHATPRPHASSRPKLLSTSILVVEKVRRPAMVVNALMVTGTVISDVDRVASCCLR